MNSVPFLDTQLVRNGPRLTYRTAWKTRSLGTRLSDLSGHLPRIHLSWMKAEIGRMARTCATYPFLEANEICIESLRQNNIDDLLLQKLESHDPFIRRAHAVSPDIPKAVYILLPFHPAFQHIGHAVTNLAREPHIQYLWNCANPKDCDMRLCPSWTNTERTLRHTVASINSKQRR